ncbi:MAG: phenylalanine--tRNA ligase subunit alpha [Actinomycetota bacterium]
MTADSALVTLDSIKKDGLTAIDRAETTEQLQGLEAALLGRKSPFAEIGRGLREFPSEDRRRVGQVSNEIRLALESALEAKLKALASTESEFRLASDRLDVTLPGRRTQLGRRHPLTQVLDRIIDTFVGLGFNVAEGPVIETDHYNFEALNFPQDHAARSMHDTFYLEPTDLDNPEALLLRTHTSPMQVRLMESTPPPLYAVVPGVCCRRDEIDANHLSVFTQIEGLAVDEGISFADLKGTLEVFAKAMFGPGLRVRMHPSYFPFTEPSAEVYVSCFACDGSGCPTCRSEGWIEIMGAGMVHPNVFRAVGYDPWITGFAFGMGIERIAKLMYSTNDLRSFYENDLRFLSGSS